MYYIENVYVCLAAPLLIAILCLKGRRRRTIILFLAGMSACLAASYISTFLAIWNGADRVAASVEIAPMVEEALKIFPVLFYLLVLEVEKEEIASGMLMVAVGFSTFENVCFLLSSGTDQLTHVLIRGFGTGAMHVVSGTMVALGLNYLWDREYMRAIGTMGLLSLSITYHAVYNLLVVQGGVAAGIGYTLPVITVLLALTLGRNILNKLIY